MRYIDSVQSAASEDFVFVDAFGNGPDGNPVTTQAASETCLGGGSASGNIAGDGNFCRPIGYADEYFVHTASLRWDNDTFRIIAGVRNLFDTAPPRVSSGAGVLQISNTAIGNGYDLNGREFFASIRARF